MSDHDAFDDPVLGSVVWNAEYWLFTVRITDGRAVRGAIEVADARTPIEAQRLHDISSYVRWVIEHENFIRQRVTDELFPGWLSGWYDKDEDEVTTHEAFYETIFLGAIHFFHDNEKPALPYNDAGLFGGHGIDLTIGMDGEFEIGPNLVG